MDTRFLAAAAVASIVMLALGAVLYGVVFAGLFAEGAIRMPGVGKETPEVWWIVAGQVGFGLLLTLVVSWRGATSPAAGFRTGALLGLLMAVGYDFAQYATTHLWTLRATLIDPLVTAVLVGVPGAVAATILGRPRRAVGAGS